MKRHLPLLAMLAAGCATAPVPAGDGFPARLTALGTEPFWNVTLEADRLRHTSPDRPPREAAVTRRVIGGMLTLTGTFAGRPMHALIRREPCSDGMSNRAYPFKMELTLEGRDLSGCAWDTASPLPTE